MFGTCTGQDGVYGVRSLAKHDRPVERAFAELEAMQDHLSCA